MFAKLVNEAIEIRFRFDWDLLEAIKSIPGRQFHDDKTGKYWSCPISQKAIEILKKSNFIIDKNLKQYFETQTETEEIEVPGLKKELFPFQKKGVAFIESRQGNVIIGDEMGLGKTIQALAWVHLHENLKPVIIVCPAHLKLNWESEIEKTLPGKQNVQVICGTDTTQLLWGSIIIINYDILANSYEEYTDTLGKKRYREIKYSGWVDYLIALKPKILIIDEAHYIKAPKAFRTKSVRKLAKHTPHRIALTGTPIINRPIEGFFISQVVNKAIFPDFWNYVHQYCDAKHNGFGWNYSGASNTQELYQKLKEIMIRRKKKQVLPELPDKIYSYVPIEIQNKTEYREAKRNFIEYLQQTKGEEAGRRAGHAQHLVQTEILKQLAVKGKIENAISWIRDFLDSNEKLVVFTVHKDIVDLLMKHFLKCAVKIDGSLSAIQKKEAEIAFQNNDRIKLLIGNIQAAGTGLTLTASSAVAFLELPWTPGELSQAEDRCHRIGQKDTVNVYYLLADDTIEGRIVKLLDEKRKIIDSTLDGKETEDIDLLETLIKSYESEVEE